MISCAKLPRGWQLQSERRNHVADGTSDTAVGSDKKPAHDVVLEMLQEGVQEYERAMLGAASGNLAPAHDAMIRIKTLHELAGRMIIPMHRLEEVQAKLDGFSAWIAENRPRLEAAELVAGNEATAAADMVHGI